MVLGGKSINPHRLISAINTHLPRDEKRQCKATAYDADADSVVKRLVNSALKLNRPIWKAKLKQKELRGRSVASSDQNKGFRMGLIWSSNLNLKRLFG